MFYFEKDELPEYIDRITRITKQRALQLNESEYFGHHSRPTYQCDLVDIIDVVNDKYPSDSPIESIIEKASFPNGRWEIPEGVDSIV